MMALLGCRLLGDFGDEPTSPMPIGNVILTGNVTFKNDIDTALLGSIRGVIASGTSVGQQIPFTDLDAQLFSYDRYATSAISIPLSVTSSGTFSFTTSMASQNLFVRISNASSTLVLLAVVNGPSAEVPISVTERSTAIGHVVLSASKRGTLLRGTEVELQVSPVSLTAIEAMVAAGMKDPVNGTRAIGDNPIVLTAAAMVTPTPTIGKPRVPDVSSWPISLLANSTNNSPVLAGLVSRYGQTLPSSLQGLSSRDLENAVKAAVAVGIDVSNTDAKKLAEDPIIRMAIRLGTPIVFENPAALTSFLPGSIGQNKGLAAGATSIAAAIGVGVESQVVLVSPSSALGTTEIYCLGANSDLMELAPEVVEAFNASDAPIVNALGSKTASLSITEPEGTDFSEIVNSVKDVLSQALFRRSTRLSRIRASSLPADVTKKEYVFKWKKKVWYPKNRGQAFVIDCSIRAQLFRGNKGDKTLRLIIDDSDNTKGFLNKGTLVFNDNNDKGYFMGGAEITITQVEGSSFTLTDNSPNRDIDDNASIGSMKSYVPRIENSSTNMRIEYAYANSKSTNRVYHSQENRSFRMDEFNCKSQQGAAKWKWKLKKCKEPGSTRNYIGFGSWKKMVEFNLWSGSVGWPMEISRGTNQQGFHPRVQACYQWTGNYRSGSTAKFKVNFEQEAWNVWTSWYNNKHRSISAARVNRYIYVDFNKMTARTPIWSTKTSNNPGAYRKMQSDGNLVIYSQSGKALWSTGTQGNHGAYDVMQEDGNLVIFAPKKLWETDTAGFPKTRRDVKRRMQADGNLEIVQFITGRRLQNSERVLWESKTSGNPGAELIMRDDGNLVILEPNPGPGKSKHRKVLWESNTAGNPGAYDVLENNGNYVVYKDDPIWSSKTQGNPGAYAVMQEDGNYVIYAGD